ncbi:acetyl-CoA hydrolase/transferase family protein [Brooklawnia cerclae]|uniref:Succinyl-CoA:acetate CoA-transferase n=1 Tax=Brooklawnia cerclae TaxID=349934 RepID=A0ABX0SJZ0_9ACTN|nr:acetyl-CoA hydrolase/transferase family protein [Brooklawnia cerclae]NIH58300.1 succinyl-CoA:acetate CoA-transferase [Brooklawnia cerclae]
MSARIAHPAFASKVMSAEDAAALIPPGASIGFSGFTGSGYPKEIPGALAKRIKAAHERGEEFTIKAFTGASTAPELDGVLADTGGMAFRTPYQSDPHLRAKINDGTTNYCDIHLSHLQKLINMGFFGKMDFAVIEATAITEHGEIIPSSSVGNNRTYLDIAEKVIIEVNSWQADDLYGLHDIYYGMDIKPRREPIPISSPGDIIGRPTFKVDPSKVVAIVETDDPDRNTPFKPLDDDSRAIAAHLLDFFDMEVKAGRMPPTLWPLQSGVGNIANAVLAGLMDAPYEHMTSYTEVIQDGMVQLIDAGKIDVASATAFSLSPDMAHHMNDHARDYHGKIILRPQDVSNHPEVIRRQFVIATNGMIEADIYGNVNSTHIMGTKMMNGVGGSGDFARNAGYSIFVSPSLAKGGDISAIVPMVSHTDHTEHDVMVIITEQGLADLRGLAPRQRVNVVIDNCAHPDYREALHEYYDRALKVSQGRGIHTPHDLGQAFSWHQRFLETGSMKEFKA